MSHCIKEGYDGYEPFAIPMLNCPSTSHHIPSTSGDPGRLFDGEIQPFALEVLHPEP